jgi:hypothetical protein
LARELETIGQIAAFSVRMRPIAVLASVWLAVIAGTSSASAFRPPETNSALPTQHQLDQHYADSPPLPYAMNYTDEVARRLGVQDGRWEVFATHPSDPLVPSFRGGVDNGGAMFKLQWQR